METVLDITANKQTKTLQIAHFVAKTNFAAPIFVLQEGDIFIVGRVSNPQSALKRRPLTENIQASNYLNIRKIECRQKYNKNTRVYPVVINVGLITSLLDKKIPN